MKTLSMLLFPIICLLLQACTNEKSTTQTLFVSPIDSTKFVVCKKKDHWTSCGLELSDCVVSGGTGQSVKMECATNVITLEVPNEEQ